MRVLYLLLLGLSSLWAQYKIIGTQIDHLRKTEAPFELTLMPTYIRLYSPGYWDTLQVDLDLVFTREKVYWLDHRASIAYEVTLKKEDTTFYQLERVGEAELEGRRARRVRLLIPQRKIEAYWSDEVPFDWRPWSAQLGYSDIILLGRALGEGIPLRLETYDNAQNLLSITRIERIMRLGQIDTFTPPYPVRRLGE